MSEALRWIGWQALRIALNLALIPLLVLVAVLGTGVGLYLAMTGRSLEPIERGL